MENFNSRTDNVDAEINAPCWKWTQKEGENFQIFKESCFISIDKHQSCAIQCSVRAIQIDASGYVWCMVNFSQKHV
jgi:hypothetical protein